LSSTSSKGGGTVPSIKKYQLIDTFERIVGSLSILASIFDVIFFFQGHLSLWVAVSFALIVISLLFVAKIWKLEKLSLDRMFAFTEAFNQGSKAIRDDFYYLRQQGKQRLLTEEQLIRNAKATCGRCVDLIAHALTTSAIENVSVCIKYFPQDYHPRNVAKLPLEDYHVKTLCRSHNTVAERSNDEGQALARIGDNTDFRLITKEQRPYFLAEDLHEFDRISRKAGFEPYQNSNLDWEKYYLSTIVVPIRIENRLVGTASSGYDLLGFLCVDSLSISAFRESDAQTYVNFLQSFAHLLYPYFERIYYLLQGIERSK
jgi:hypothetical protein